MNNIPEANGSENGRVLGTSMAYGFMLGELPATQERDVITAGDRYMIQARTRWIFYSFFTTFTEL